MSDDAQPELRAPEVKRDAAGRILKGHTINPGGQSKEKRAFLERLTTEDADEVYESFMALVREKNPPAVLRAVEYLAGKPASAPADLAAIAKNGNVLAVLTRDDMLAIAKGETP